MCGAHRIMSADIIPAPVRCPAKRDNIPSRTVCTHRREYVRSIEYNVHGDGHLKG